MLFVFMETGKPEATTLKQPVVLSSSIHMIRNGSIKPPEAYMSEMMSRVGAYLRGRAIKSTCPEVYNTVRVYTER